MWFTVVAFESGVLPVWLSNRTETSWIQSWKQPPRYLQWGNVVKWTVTISEGAQWRSGLQHGQATAFYPSISPTAAESVSTTSIIHIADLWLTTASRNAPRSSSLLAQYNQLIWIILMDTFFFPIISSCPLQYSTFKFRPCSLTTASFLSEISDQRIGILCQEIAFGLCSSNLNSLRVAVTKKRNQLTGKGDKRHFPQDRKQNLQFSFRFIEKSSPYQSKTKSCLFSYFSLILC